MEWNKRTNENFCGGCWCELRDQFFDFSLHATSPHTSIPIWYIRGRFMKNVQSARGSALAHQLRNSTILTNIDYNFYVVSIRDTNYKFLYLGSLHWFTIFVFFFSSSLIGECECKHCYSCVPQRSTLFAAPISDSLNTKHIYFCFALKKKSTKSRHRCNGDYNKLKMRFHFFGIRSDAILWFIVNW